MLSNAILNGIVKALLEELLLFCTLFLNLKNTFLILDNICALYFVSTVQNFRLIGFALHVVHEG
jgi:hypothetical protein